MPPLIAFRLLCVSPGGGSGEARRRRRRPQDSDHWVCITREDGGPALVMPMLLETVEMGLRVYRARAKLAVRRYTSARIPSFHRTTCRTTTRYLGGRLSLALAAGGGCVWRCGSAPGIRDEFRTWRRLAPGELVAVDLLRRLPLGMSGQTMGGPTAIAEGGAGALEVPSSVGASKQGVDGTKEVHLRPPSLRRCT